MNRSLWSLTALKREDGGLDVVFSERSVMGGEDGFNRLNVGDEVKFAQWPTMIGGSVFAARVEHERIR